MNNRWSLGDGCVFALAVSLALWLAIFMVLR